MSLSQFLKPECSGITFLSTSKLRWTGALSASSWSRKDCTVPMWDKSISFCPISMVQLLLFPCCRPAGPAQDGSGEPPPRGRDLVQKRWVYLRQQPGAQTGQSQWSGERMYTTTQSTSCTPSASRIPPGLEACSNGSQKYSGRSLICWHHQHVQTVSMQ